MKKAVIKQKDWDLVLGELQREKIKLMSYDNTIINSIGNIKGIRVLDYGAGPGILAGVLLKLGANVKIYEVNKKILEAAARRIGKENVYGDLKRLPYNYFDSVICNLVLCIVDEGELRRILKTIHKLLVPKGIAFFGFCNPMIYQIQESHIDYRYPTGDAYDKNHVYKKIKKEGGYEVHEQHRPVSWYEKEFIRYGFSISDYLFTPGYDYKENHIKDFIIFKCFKKE